MKFKLIIAALASALGLSFAGSASAQANNAPGPKPVQNAADKPATPAKSAKKTKKGSAKKGKTSKKARPAP